MFVLDGRGNKRPEVIEISDSVNVVAEYRDGEERILFVEINGKYVVCVSAKMRRTNAFFALSIADYAIARNT